MTFLRLKLGSKSHTSEALARLDERLAPSPVGTGLIERFHFADACASLWLDDELVEMEDLILHDAARDIRSPQTCSDHCPRRVADARAHRHACAGRALSPSGLRSLRQGWLVAKPGCDGIGADNEIAAVQKATVDSQGRHDRLDEGVALLGIDLIAIDAVLARSEDVLARVKQPQRLAKPETDPLSRDPEWDEERPSHGSNGFVGL
ncbi:hypothetical protein [Brucella pseudogrignonensis]|uniref:hypothetical protein n=1 Tax=Brucella pseudogrignonensis TaxID=419475 RepID=UPI001F278800|nr:hypothetical protein [Brucella pseudogrignonensis]